MFVGVALAGGERARGKLSLTISRAIKYKFYKYMQYNAVKLEDSLPLCECLDPISPGVS